MIPKLSRAHFQVAIISVPGLRPKSVHRLDFRHVLTIFLFTNRSFSLKGDIPLDKIALFSYAFCVGTDRTPRAIPIGAGRPRDLGFPVQQAS